MKEIKKHTIKVSYSNKTYDVNHLYNNRGFFSQSTNRYPYRLRRDTLRLDANTNSRALVCLK